MAGESWKLGRRRIESEAGSSRIGKARGRGEGKSQRLWMLSGEVRDSPFPFPQFIDLGEPLSRELRAPHAFTAGDTVCADRRAPPC
jgi:hypothetical protein